MESSIDSLGIRLASGQRLRLCTSRSRQKQLELGLRVAPDESLHVLAQLIDLVVFDPDTKAWQRSGWTLVEFLKDRAFRDADGANRLVAAIQAYEPSLRILAKSLARNRIDRTLVAVPPPPFTSTLAVQVQRQGPRMALAKDWIGFVQRLSKAGVRREEIDHSGVLARLVRLPPNVRLSCTEVLDQVRLSHAVPRIVQQARGGRLSRGGSAAAGDKESEELLVQLDDWVDEFWSHHFIGIRNVLLHVRAGQRRLVDGRTLLYLEEVQSDWYACARGKASRRIRLPVPPAPFVKDWPLLALKVMLWRAQATGCNGLAFSTGRIQETLWRPHTPPTVLYDTILPHEARVLARTLGLAVDSVAVEVPTEGHVQPESPGSTGGSFVANRQPTGQLASSVRGARVRADGPSQFRVPVLWFDALPSLRSIPLYGYGTRQDWFRSPGTASIGPRPRDLLTAPIQSIFQTAGIQPSSATTPAQPHDMLCEWIALADGCFLAGARGFPEFVQAMAADTGDELRQHLKSLYALVALYPGRIDLKGQSSLKQVLAADVNALLRRSRPHGSTQPGRRSN